MKYIFWIIILITINSGILFSNYEDFKKANNSFNNGDYKESVRLYTLLLDSGYIESEVYFNLANSYFRLNNIPQAILNYERAKRLNPADDDIDFNLKLANLKIVDKFEPVPKIFILEWYDQAITLLYSGDWGLFTIICIWIFFATLLLLFIGFAPKIRSWLVLLLLISLILALSSSFLGYKAHKNENSKDYGIIFVPSVYVKSAPDPGSTDLFILHEGTKIQKMETIDDWYQIKVENGDIGWIKKDDVEII